MKIYESTKNGMHIDMHPILIVSLVDDPYSYNAFDSFN